MEGEYKITYDIFNGSINLSKEVYIILTEPALNIPGVNIIVNKYDTMTIKKTENYELSIPDKYKDRYDIFNIDDAVMNCIYIVNNYLQNPNPVVIAGVIPKLRRLNKIKKIEKTIKLVRNILIFEFIMAFVLVIMSVISIADDRIRFAFSIISCIYFGIDIVILFFLCIEVVGSIGKIKELI